MNKRIDFGYFSSKLIIPLLIFSGLALRILTIAKRNLWFDELLTNNFSYQSICLKSKLFGLSAFPYYLYKIKTDPISFIYSIAVYLFSFLFGNWESLRYLSAISSFFSVLIFYRLCGLFLDKKERIYALAIMAFSPFQIWYAQEAREYAFQSFFSVLLIYSYCKALKNNRPFNWVIFSFAGIIALYSNYYFLFLIAATGLFLLIRKNRRLIKNWFLSVLAMAVFLLPSLPLFMRQLALTWDKFWLHVPGLVSIPFSLGVLVLGYSSSLPQLAAGITLFSILFIYGIYAYCRSSREDAIFMLLLFLFPLLLIFIISRAIKPIYLDRKFIIFAPFYYIILSKSFGSLKNIILKIPILIISLFLVASSLFNYYRNTPMITRTDGKDFYQGVHFKKDYSGLMSFVTNNFADNDIVCSTDAQSCIISCGYFERHDAASLLKSYNFIFYPKLLSPYETKYMKLSRHNKEILAAGNAQPLIRQEKNGRGVIVSSDELDKQGRIWLISSLWETKGALSRNSKKVNDYLSARYRKVLSCGWDGIFVTLFEASNK